MHDTQFRRKILLINAHVAVVLSDECSDLLDDVSRHGIVWGEYMLSCIECHKHLQWSLASMLVCQSIVKLVHSSNSCIVWLRLTAAKAQTSLKTCPFLLSISRGCSQDACSKTRNLQAAISVKSKMFHGTNICHGSKQLRVVPSFYPVVIRIWPPSSNYWYHVFKCLMTVARCQYLHRNIYDRSSVRLHSVSCCWNNVPAFYAKAFHQEGKSNNVILCRKFSYTWQN